MRTAGVLVALHAAACGSQAAPAPRVAPAEAAAVAAISEAELLGDVAWLTSPALAGRGSYSPEARAAADGIAERFAAAGLEIALQPIPDSGGQVNVIGILRGSDEVVVVSAHYDHLGVVDGAIHFGADDNASGTAVLLALARAVGRTHRGRTIVFLAAGAEEYGLLGSRAYVAAPAMPLEKTRAVLNFDMVGRRFFEAGLNLDRAVGVVDLERDPEIRAAIERAAAAEGVNPWGVSARFMAKLGWDRASDDASFRAVGVPAVHLSTSLHADYHRPSDTADRLDRAQLGRIARLGARALVELGRLELHGGAR